MFIFPLARTFYLRELCCAQLRVVEAALHTSENAAVRLHADRRRRVRAAKTRDGRRSGWRRISISENVDERFAL